MKLLSTIKSWFIDHKAVSITIVAIIVVTLAAIVALATGSDEAEYISATSESVIEEVEEITEVDLTIVVTADMDWTVDSTPAFAYIEGETDDEEISLYTAIYADEEGNYGESTVTLPLGTYTVSFISPINEDGSAYLYEMSDNVKVTVVAITEDDADETEETSEVSEMYVTSESSVEADEADEVNTVYCEMTKINAEDVTDEMLAEIVSEIRTALDTDDSILEESTVEEFVTKLETNVSANPNASETTIANVGAIITGEIVAETASESNSEEETSEADSDNASDASASGSTSGTTSSGTTSGTTNSGTTSSGSSSSGNSSSGSSSSGSTSSGSSSSGNTSSSSTNSGTTSSGSTNSGTSSSNNSSSTSECDHDWACDEVPYTSIVCFGNGIDNFPTAGFSTQTEELEAEWEAHISTCTAEHTYGTNYTLNYYCTKCGAVGGPMSSS